jgi:hypothetical protein
MKFGLDTSRPAYVPLRDAMLCVDCEFVSPAANGKCSICGSNRLVVLSELLEFLAIQAYGAKTPIRLAELFSMLAASASVSQQKPDRAELWRYP